MLNQSFYYDAEFRFLNFEIGLKLTSQNRWPTTQLTQISSHIAEIKISISRKLRHKLIASTEGMNYTSRAKGNTALHEFDLVTLMIRERAQWSVNPPKRASLHSSVLRRSRVGKCWGSYQNYLHYANQTDQRHLRGDDEPFWACLQVAGQSSNDSMKSLTHLLTGPWKKGCVSYSAQPSVSVKVSLNNLSWNRLLVSPD